MNANRIAHDAFPRFPELAGRSVLIKGGASALRSELVVR